MRTFLIHDELRKDREKLYLEEVRVQGITGLEIVPAFKFYSNVQKNISEAHKGCIRKAQEDDLPRVMVLEDDVKFSAPGAYNEFIRLSYHLPEDWDIYIGGSYDYYHAKTEEHGTHISEPLTKLRKFAGLHCYMVNKKFYKTFLETRGLNNLDKALTGNIWMMYPMGALQWDTFSDNTNKITYYNSVFANKIKLWKNQNSKN
jgi:GR25 family glycosyltransferase involved in LPS biosynthesis